MLQRYGHHDLEGDIAPHIVDTTTTSDYVFVGIFQTTQVVLVGFVQEVVGGDVEFCNFLALYLYICACRKTEQSIAGRWCLSIIGTVDVRLFQIAVKTSGDIEVVEQRTMDCL